ncbi:hypothetical protein AGR3A_Cc280066 [Agrobacterium tomkonis CFBP 6623]|uniref:Uncharacterized protein n=1 Tax=Agrobacterium tomkonis CFBP 6623 TaxID=1183432 RepID=A0A1S7PPR6_9HYPH|nr:hypothetical protein AGR3A_Cc280066 [Agrobacterium tomkonis CFBP 6623]
MRANFRSQTAIADRVLPETMFREAGKEAFTMSPCGTGRYSEPVFAALPAQKALTTPN